MKPNSIGKKHTSNEIEAISENLLALRRHRGIHQISVANGALVSRSTMYKLENGNSAAVSVWRLFDVCQYYGVKPDTVLIKGYYLDPKNLPKR